MLLEDLAQVTAQYLQGLCDDRCPESETLDFKRKLPGKSDEDKREFLKDVCALANADGGDLVYGLDEAHGTASSLVPESSEPADAAKRRIAQVLDAGLEPRVPGVMLYHVEVPGGYVLVMRVPASYDGPHCVRANNNRRFVMRNGTSTTDMTYEQIRSAFDRTATLADKARRFVAERHELIASRKTATPMMNGPIWVLHLVPLAGIAGRRTANLLEISQSFAKLAGMRWPSASRAFNFDGLVVHPGGINQDGYYTYNHVFRTGAVEATRIGGAKQLAHGGSERSIVWSLDMSKFFHSSATKIAAEAKNWGFGGPALLGIAILDAKGFELGVDEMMIFNRFNRATVDRSHLIPSEVWIENLDSMNVDDALRPSLDTLWQAFGLERCMDFDEQSGAYNPRRGV